MIFKQLLISFSLNFKFSSARSFNWSTLIILILLFEDISWWQSLGTAKSTIVVFELLGLIKAYFSLSKIGSFDAVALIIISKSIKIIKTLLMMIIYKIVLK